MAFAKITFFLLYLQIFRPMLWLRYCSYLGILFTSLFYLAIIIFTLVLTVPAPGQSWQEASRGSSYKAVLKATVWIASVGLVLDVIIFVLPIIGVQQLQLSRKRKIGVIAVFLTRLLYVDLMIKLGSRFNAKQLTFISGHVLHRRLAFIISGSLITTAALQI